MADEGSQAWATGDTNENSCSFLSLSVSQSHSLLASSSHNPLYGTQLKMFSVTERLNVAAVVRGAYSHSLLNYIWDKHDKKEETKKKSPNKY